MDRRQALRRLGVGGAALGLGGAAIAGCDFRGVPPGAGFQVPIGPMGPIGIQLHTVRASVQQDLPRALGDVAAIGYREVEFAGYYGYPPRQVRNALASAGLAAPSAWVDVDQLVEDWFPTLEAAVEIGHRWLVVAWLPEEMRSSLEAWRLTAELFNRAADEASIAGVRLAYHNRDFDFMTLEERRPIEVLLEETDPAFFDLALDVFWMMQAGADPLDFLDRWPGRTPILHLNDRAPNGRMAAVGAGTFDWPGILSRRFSAGILHAFVDHEEADDPFGMSRDSFAYLNELQV